MNGCKSVNNAISGNTDLQGISTRDGRDNAQRWKIQKRMALIDRNLRCN